MKASLASRTPNAARALSSEGSAIADPFSDPLEARIAAHLRYDTIEWASPAKLAVVTRFAARVVESLQDRDPAWTREPVG